MLSVTFFAIVSTANAATRLKHHAGIILQPLVCNRYEQACARPVGA
jgi:hypothetical protein